MSYTGIFHEKAREAADRKHIPATETTINALFLDARLCAGISPGSANRIGRLRVTDSGMARRSTSFRETAYAYVKSRWRFQKRTQIFEERKSAIRHQIDKPRIIEFLFVRESDNDY
jgi:hypothetical protein